MAHVANFLTCYTREYPAPKLDADVYGCFQRRHIRKDSTAVVDYSNTKW